MVKLLKNLISASTQVYLVLLLAWLVSYLLTGDQIPYISAIHMLAVYLFLPLPVIIFAALFLQRREIWIGALLATIAFSWFFGGLFIPRPPSSTENPASGRNLTVLTYNVLGYHIFTDPLIATIQAENPDVVLLQELNPQLAVALQEDLINEYPYQILEPATGVSGMGVISRYHISPSGEALSGDWLYRPQVLDLEWHGEIIKVINFHMVPTTGPDPGVISRTNQLRKVQAGSIADYARRTGPLIAGGDANATPLSDVHELLTGELIDAWKQGGFGLGHTFPGSDIPGSSRPHIAGYPVPKWLARIDYIFHSPHWTTLEARVAKFDRVSDHRGVVAELMQEE